MGRYLDIVRQAAAESLAPVQTGHVRLTTSSAAVIEATFRPAADVSTHESVSPTNTQFPPCPVYGATRYWISRGLVRCGSKSCYSAPRFVLVSIEFHPVQ